MESRDELTVSGRVTARNHLFLRNAWYCAGWDYNVSQAKDAVVARQIAGERLVLYRKPDGAVVAMEDRCPHRHASLSMGGKEGDSLRCVYHGMKFGPNGQCIEVPGQSTVPERACVRTFPVVERDNWIWVWMGEPEKAEPGLIPFAVGYGDPDWNMRTSEIHIETNYRLEIANLMDLSHLTWTHANSLGGTDAYTKALIEHQIQDRGVVTDFWMRGVPLPVFAQHLFPPEMLFDMHVNVQFSVPCNFMLRFEVHAGGNAKEGPSDGLLLLDTWSCQAVTPCDADSVDYYYSWGTSKATDRPGMADMMRTANIQAFNEDKVVLEAQHRNMKEKPDAPIVGIKHDAGPAKMLRILDGLIAQEARRVALA